MAKYLVEFTEWIPVTAPDEESALDKALDKIENTYPDGTISLGDVEESH
jgi:hypothetical protein